MKKILLSLATIAFVGSLGFAATNAFLSDAETSTGNLLEAGEIDLRIDNESYYTDQNGNLVASPATSWGDLRDLTVEKFFNFTDIKPGDLGESTISVHVGSNNAWVCAAIRLTTDEDVSCTEPEMDDDPACSEPGAGLGELDDEVKIAFWVDDGDNVLENDETPFLNSSLKALGQQEKIVLADSQSSVLKTAGPIGGGSSFYLGKAWCFGTLNLAPVAQGESTGPLVRGTGFTCDGSLVSNAAQTDRVIGSLQFYAAQSGNNPDFTCASDYVLNWEPVAPTPTSAPATPTPVSVTPTVTVTPPIAVEICGNGIDDDGDQSIDEECQAWINEIHYDNDSTDINEGIEIAGPVGLNLTGWKIALYNGDGGAVYYTVNLSGIIPDQQAGFGTLWFSKADIQNGSPDGLALVSPGGSINQFLSYEGVFSASAGPASGLTSVDIGFSEADNSPVDQSLQLQGIGNAYGEFTWAIPITNTRGVVNTNQTFN